MSGIQRVQIVPLGAARDAVLTWTLVVVNVLWFIVHHLGINVWNFQITDAGALRSADIGQGQWFELFSSLFVHFNGAHLIFNMMSLASLYFVEVIVKSRCFVVIYVLSGVLGNLLSLVVLSPNVTSGGASGAIFGVLGCALVLAYRRQVPQAVFYQLLMILMINIILGFTNAGIDLAAHMGALIVGIVLEVWYQEWASRRQFVVVGAALSVAVCAFAMLCTL